MVSISPYSSILLRRLLQLHAHLHKDITLGTLFDRYGDEEEAYKLAKETGAGTAGPELTRVLQWGLGEIGLSDVNLASAGDGKCAVWVHMASTRLIILQCSFPKQR